MVDYRDIALVVYVHQVRRLHSTFPEILVVDHTLSGKYVYACTLWTKRLCKREPLRLPVSTKLIFTFPQPRGDEALENSGFVHRMTYGVDNRMSGGRRS